MDEVEGIHSQDDHDSIQDDYSIHSHPTSQTEDSISLTEISLRADDDTIPPITQLDGAVHSPS